MTRDKRIQWTGSAPPAARSTVRGLNLRWVMEADPNGVLDRLKCEYVDLIVIDLRAAPAAGFGLLDILDTPDDIEARYGFHRLVCIVGG
jgi:hypothetical protein